MSGPSERDEPRSDFGRAQGADEAYEVVWRKKDGEQASKSEQQTPDAAQSPASDTSRAEEYLANWQRSAADMANMRRRHETDKADFRKYANSSIMTDLLPVMDSFDRAMASVPTDLREQKWIEGILLVQRQLHAALERNGLSIIEAEGKPFNPEEHEALAHERSDAPDDTVIQELQRGYKLHDRVIRPAMVKVSQQN